MWRSTSLHKCNGQESTWNLLPYGEGRSPCSISVKQNAMQFISTNSYWHSFYVRKLRRAMTGARGSQVRHKGFHHKREIPWGGQRRWSDRSSQTQSKEHLPLPISLQTSLPTMMQSTQRQEKACFLKVVLLIFNYVYPLNTKMAFYVYLLSSSSLMCLRFQLQCLVRGNWFMHHPPNAPAGMEAAQSFVTVLLVMFQSFWKVKKTPAKHQPKITTWDQHTLRTVQERILHTGMTTNWKRYKCSTLRKRYHPECI